MVEPAPNPKHFGDTPSLSITTAGQVGSIAIEDLGQLAHTTLKQMGFHAGEVGAGRLDGRGTLAVGLHDRLTEDLKLAMKARDQLRMDVIRMIKAAALNKEVELKKDLDDADMSRIMTTMIKQRKESIEQFEKGNRAELAASVSPVGAIQANRVAFGLRPRSSGRRQAGDTAPLRP